MKRSSKNVFICLVILVSQFIHCPTLPAAEKHSLWKIETGRNTVYLLGSVHALKKENFPLAPEIEKAYNDSQQIIFELNLDSAVTPAAQQYMVRKGMLSNGNTLQTMLSDSVYRAAGNLCRSMGLDIRQLNSLKPWMFSVTLLGLKLRQIGFNPEYGIDKYFFKKAKRDGKNIRGLETLQLQLGIFDRLPVKTQEMFVLQMIKEFEVFDKELADLVSAWERGSTGQLSRLLLDSFKEYPDLYQSMVVERNTNWLDQILAFLNDDENYLVVVGAGHMIGDDGLISLLRQKGFIAVQL